MKAAQEVRAQWEENRARQEANYKSFNSLESEESSVASSDAPSEKETRYGNEYSLYYFNTSVMAHGLLLHLINHGSECIPCPLEQGATIVFFLSYFYNNDIHTN